MGLRFSNLMYLEIKEVFKDFFFRLIKIKKIKQTVQKELDVESKK